MAVITKIPATKNKFTAAPISQKQKRRVAGYARVSTDKKEQITSYQAQVEYYKKYIQDNPDWIFVHVYTDEGVTGTSTKSRKGFNDMIDDALAGKIDLIVTKSISRFARNTVDSLVNIRKLKDAGCECFFEEQNIWTFDSTGELMLTILSSIAQEEARNISENVTWGQRKRFADGKMIMPYKRFLGYDKGNDGKPVINPQEAQIVRTIYRMFIEGKTPFMICKYLDEHKIKTPGGKDKWARSTVLSILTNEKYKGDALLQKKFTVDYLTKKQKRNEGEVPQYYVEDSHPAIIDPREWDAVQAELERRKRMGKSYSGTSIFSSKLICADCGDYYGLKVWHSTDAYRKEVWRCNHKFDGDKKCSTPHLITEQIQSLFLQAYNELMQDRTQVIADCAVMRDVLLDTSAIQSQIAKVDAEIEVTTALVAVAVKENATLPQSQEEYNKKYAALEERFLEQKDKRAALEAKVEERKARAHELDLFIDALAERDLLLETWDDQLWLTLVENGTVLPDGSINFLFKNGTEILAAE